MTNNNSKLQSEINIHKLKKYFEEISGISFGDFLEKYADFEVEKKLKDEFPFIYTYLYDGMRTKFREINFYSLFFENGLASRIIDALISYGPLSTRLPSCCFKNVLNNLENLLNFLESHPFFKKETLFSRTNTYLDSIGKRTSLKNIENFSISLWFEVYGMASFLCQLPESISGYAEFLEKNENRENCDGRFIATTGEVTLFEFKNKNLSHGEIENNFKTSINDFLIDHRINLGKLITLFYPDCKDIMTGFKVESQMYYEEPIEYLAKVIEKSISLPLKGKIPKLKKEHEKTMLLWMIEHNSQNITNQKPAFLIPSDNTRIESIQTDILKVTQKKFWPKILNKALSQLSETRRSHLKEGYNVNKCLVYIFWKRPSSMLPDIFAENPILISNQTFDFLKNELERIFIASIKESQQEMLGIAELRLFDRFNFSELTITQKT